jgi:hypothetical protein
MRRSVIGRKMDGVNVSLGVLEVELKAFFQGVVE